MFWKIKICPLLNGVLNIENLKKKISFNGTSELLIKKISFINISIIGIVAKTFTLIYHLSAQFLEKFTINQSTF